ncbi:hypothetical protein D3C74_346430 [compost metagenome]
MQAFLLILSKLAIPSNIPALLQAFACWLHCLLKKLHICSFFLISRLSTTHVLDVCSFSGILHLLFRTSALPPPVPPHAYTSSLHQTSPPQVILSNVSKRPFIFRYCTGESRTEVKGLMNCSGYSRLLVKIKT